ncbi:unnamed protein product [Cuscuta campestris]|uniref:Uncharacterized protein n=1 Tax=Cuscuta campestris TaxID=132261 RepID=A0A484NSI1_9ASTE|nr:unnamed protein product [Cuscuta campestris]
MVDPSNFEGIPETKFEKEEDHVSNGQDDEEGDQSNLNEEEEIKDGKEDDGKEEDELVAVNMVDPSNFEGIPEEKEDDHVSNGQGDEEGDQYNLNEEEEIKDGSPPIQHYISNGQEEEEEKFTVHGEALEDEMTISDKIVHDVVEFYKSTENNVDEELGRGLREKKRSIHISSPYFANVHKKIKGESHGIVKKWWSSLIKAGGWLETLHMEEIMIYFMQMYNKKDSTYAILLECFQMLSEVNVTTDFPILGSGVTQIVEGRWNTCSKPWKDISCVYWLHNIFDHWVAIRAEFDRKCMVVFDSLQRITTMSKLEEVLSRMLKVFPVICHYASTFLQVRNTFLDSPLELKASAMSVEHDLGDYGKHQFKGGQKEAHNVIPKESYLELPRSFCTDNGISEGKMKIQMFGPAMSPNEGTMFLADLKMATNKFNNDLIDSKTRKKVPNVVYRWKCRSNQIITAKLFSK